MSEPLERVEARLITDGRYTSRIIYEAHEKGSFVYAIDAILKIGELEKRIKFFEDTEGLDSVRADVAEKQSLQAREALQSIAARGDVRAWKLREMAEDALVNIYGEQL